MPAGAPGVLRWQFDPQAAREQRPRGGGWKEGVSYCRTTGSSDPGQPAGVVVIGAARKATWAWGRREFDGDVYAIGTIVKVAGDGCPMQSLFSAASRAPRSGRNFAWHCNQ